MLITTFYYNLVTVNQSGFTSWILVNWKETLASKLKTTSYLPY